jgi:AraC-like DNA-binding protein
MKPATPDQMERDPVGCFVCGDGYVHFCASPTLWGMILWGRPSMETALAVGRTLPFELLTGVAPHASIVDVRRIEGGDSTAFQALAWYLQHHADRLAEQVLCLGLVRPSGIGGAMVAGVPRVLRYPYPIEVFKELGPALRWIASHGVPLSPDEEEARIEQLYATATATPPLVTGLRALLDRNLQKSPSLADAAQRLGTSERTLQRKLAEAGTSYKHELGEARVRAAKQLMLDGNAPVTTIALEVGCSSLQHFSALFRKATGQSPSEWRAARRARSRRTRLT